MRFLLKNKVLGIYISMNFDLIEFLYKVSPGVQTNRDASLQLLEQKPIIPMELCTLTKVWL